MNRRTALLTGSSAVVLAGCGGNPFAKKETPPTCGIADPKSRAVVGVALQRAKGTASYTIEPVTARERRSGALKGLQMGEVKLSPGSRGGLFGRKPGANLTPIQGLPSVPMVLANTFSYTKGTSFEGAMIAGPAPLPSDVPGSGSLVLRGTALLTLSLLSGQTLTQTRITASVSLLVGMASKMAVLEVTNPKPDGGASIAFSGVKWNNAGLCGARIVSTGQGQARIVDGRGLPIGLTGGKPDPMVTAVLDALLFSSSSQTALPDSAGGVLLIQGDTGSLAGVFLAKSA